MTKIEAVVIGTSSGGIEALKKLLPALPGNYPLPIVIVLHISADHRSLLSEIFKNRVNLLVKEADEKESILPGTIYFAPPNYHLLVEKDRTFSLTVEEPVHYSRPSIDVLFESAAACYGPNLVGVLLSGANEDGAQGLKKIKQFGGMRIIQENAEMTMMPKSGLPYVSPNGQLTLDKIATFLQELNGMGK